MNLRDKIKFLENEKRILIEQVEQLRKSQCSEKCFMKKVLNDLDSRGF